MVSYALFAECLTDLLQPLRPPKVKAGAITIAKISSALAHDALQQDDPCRPLNTQVSLIDEAL
jgi:hypothetical protein